MIDSQFFYEKEICIRSISIISGSRPAGRTVDHLQMPRADHGLLFRWEGEALFSSAAHANITVHPGELFYIPAGFYYKMKYTAKATAFVLVNMELQTEYGKAAALSNHMATLARDDKGHRLFEIMAGFERCIPGRKGRIKKQAENAALPVSFFRAMPLFFCHNTACFHAVIAKVFQRRRINFFPSR